MRKLNTGDVFAALRVIKKLGLKDEIKEFALEAEKAGTTDVMEVGAKVLGIVFEKMVDETAEKTVYDFLARPLEVSPDEVAKVELLELVKQLEEIADIEGWRAFLSRAASLM